MLVPTIGWLFHGVACGGAPRPSDPPVTSEDARGTTVPAAAAPVPGGDPKVFIGQRSADLMLEPPAGFSPAGDAMFAIEGQSLGYTYGSFAGGGLITLDERKEEGDDEAYFEILDVVTTSDPLRSERIADGCKRDDRMVPALVAVVPDVTGCDPIAPVHAWSVDVEKRQLVPVDTSTLRCKRFHCGDPGVPLGVPGDAPG